MKTLANYSPTPDTIAVTGTSGLPYLADVLSGHSSRYNQSLPALTYRSPETTIRQNAILTNEAATQIASGDIPDFRRVCLDLFHTFFTTGAPYSALQFIPILKTFDRLDRAEINRFMKNPATRHVLVNNALLKVVLIHWKPGDFSGIHGHPKGGCVFKVLKGALEEKRYSPDTSQRLLAASTFQQGSMAYIDDNMAHHAVGNPFSTSAISLHVYTPGKNQ